MSTMTSEVLTGLSVLVLEDEPLWRRHLVASLERWGAEVAAVDSMAGARKALGAANFDFALMDVNLPDGLGPDLLRDKSIPAHTGVVIMTAEGGISGAVEAIRLGALDYLTKPFEPEALALTLRRARSTQAGRRVAEQQRSGSPGFFFGTALSGLKTQIERILAADRRMETHLPSVLIEGETGTGKTSLARRIHREGPRADGPWVEINCSAIPEHLAESELFGHEKGAFTDARSTRIGLFEAAHGGTLFLDELSSLSLPIQAKLLTVLEDHRIRRVGGSKDIAVDVRVIAATNQGLRQLVAQGSFRSDLLHRLDLFRLSILPLRDRGADLLPLAASLMEGIASRHRLPVRSISETGRRRLLGYGWPGNVRELAHELERSLVFEDGDALNFDSLLGAGGGTAENGTSMGMTPVGVPAGSADSWWNPAFQFPDQGFDLEAAILHLIQQALQQSAGNVSAAARRLGVSRDYLRYRLGPKGGH
jgi:two-component system, NtrC family, response regulator AtoC